MDQHTLVFKELINEGTQLLENDTENEQVIVVKTAKGHIYHCINHSMGRRSGFEYDVTDEESFISMLRDKDDTEIQAIVALWNPRVTEKSTSASCSVDIPSWYLRQCLFNLHPENQNALILLVGDQNYLAKKLGDLMLKKD